MQVLLRLAKKGLDGWQPHPSPAPNMHHTAAGALLPLSGS